MSAKSQNNKALDSANKAGFLQDSTQKLRIQNIIITGNKKTKDYIILRELQFKKGDYILRGALEKKVQQAQHLVYNTTLFSDVQIQIVPQVGNEIVVMVEVKERWYFYPIPQFKPVDRNFNEWIKTYHASLKRVNYGVKFVDYNLTGKKDLLRLYVSNGFSRDFSANYYVPFTNAKLTNGFIVGASYSQKKEIAYKTNYTDSLLFYTSDSLRSQFVGSNFNVFASYILRKNFYHKHIFSISFSRLTISDSLLLPKNNPNYFNENTTAKNFVELSYTYQYTNVNNVLYPTAGTTAFVALAKRGFAFTGGINALSIEAGINKYYSLGNKWYSSFLANGKLKLPLHQAYINQKALGYAENYLRGLEYYVIDGTATALLKSTLKKQIAQFKIRSPFKIKADSYIPFTLFAKAYTDVGTVYNEKEFATNLSNKFLYTGGIGLDIVSFYDVTIRLEYSFNQLHQKGLFLHTQAGF